MNPCKPCSLTTCTVTKPVQWGVGPDMKERGSTLGHYTPLSSSPGLRATHHSRERHTRRPSSMSPRVTMTLMMRCLMPYPVMQRTSSRNYSSELLGKSTNLHVHVLHTMYVHVHVHVHGATVSIERVNVYSYDTYIVHV